MAAVNTDIARLLFNELRINVIELYKRNRLSGKHLMFDRMHKKYRTATTNEVYSFATYFMSKLKAYRKYATVVLQTAKNLRLVSSHFAVITSFEIAQTTDTDYGVLPHSQLLLLNTRLTSLEHKKTYCYQSVVQQTIALFDSKQVYASTISFKQTSLMHRLIMSERTLWYEIYQLFVCMIDNKKALYQPDRALPYNNIRPSDDIRITFDVSSDTDSYDYTDSSESDYTTTDINSESDSDN